MATHVQFAIAGPPISNQQSTAKGRANLATWRGVIGGAVTLLWTKPLLTGNLKAIIINFYEGDGPSVDVDNMSKPILDEMQDILYEDDRQISQAEISHVKIGSAFSIMGASKILVNAIRAGSQFVYVRIEDPVDPFPLPK